MQMRSFVTTKNEIVGLGVQVEAVEGKYTKYDAL